MIQVMTRGASRKDKPWSGVTIIPMDRWNRRPKYSLLYWFTTFPLYQYWSYTHEYKLTLHRNFNTDRCHWCDARVKDSKHPIERQGPRLLLQTRATETARKSLVRHPRRRNTRSGDGNCQSQHGLLIRSLQGVRFPQRVAIKIRFVPTTSQIPTNPPR